MKRENRNTERQRQPNYFGRRIFIVRKSVKTEYYTHCLETFFAVT